MITVNPNFVVSFLGGGLAGGCVSLIGNRIFYFRGLRTRFHPVLNNVLGAYACRMEKPDGRFWVTIVGNSPAEKDREFIELRTNFILRDLVEFNELKEARTLRKHILANVSQGSHDPGNVARMDLAPEYHAISACLTRLQKKLSL